ncbi:MAG: protein kinase, partial [bacterium]
MRATPAVMTSNEVTEYDVLKKDSIQGYTILNEVGKGASGVVYAARQVEGGRLVAIKVFYSHYSRNKEFIGRLIREAETLKKIHHENIVQGFGHGFSHGYYYTVMEFVEGSNLESRMRQDGALEEE